MEFAWGSGTGIDPALRLAQLVGSGALLFAAALVIATAFVRISFLVRRADHARALQVWRPLLSAAVLGEFENVEQLRLKRSQVMAFLGEWNKLHSRLRGEASDNLNQLAVRLALDHEARRLMTSRNRHDRLLGIVTAGQLGDRESHAALGCLLLGEDPVTSMAAARALLQIDARANAPAVLAEAAIRQDWPQARLASILKDAEAGVLCDLLSERVREAAPEGLPRLLELLDVLECRTDLDAILTALETSEDAETIAACLRILNDPRGLPMVRFYIQDERWPVRLQAAKALGRLGKRVDLALLAGLLSDPVWWIRYRSAQAIAEFPFVEADELHQLKDACEDPFGRDALEQIISERELS